MVKEIKAEEGIWFPGATGTEWTVVLNEDGSVEEIRKGCFYTFVDGEAGLAPHFSRVYFYCQAPDEIGAYNEYLKSKKEK